MSRPRALVTGASSGIGREIARELAGRGWNLVVVARSGDELRELAAELEAGHGIDVRVRVADLSDVAALDGLAEQVAAADAPLDLLALVAGFGRVGPWVEADAEVERSMLDLNVVGTTRLARHLVPPMIDRRCGRVMAVSSLGAFLPGPGMAVYYGTRAYVTTWARSLDEELRETGVTVTCVCPGPVPTGFQARAGFRPGTEATPLTVSSRRVARAAVEGTLRGRRLVVPGWGNRVVRFLTRLIPWRWLAPIVHRVQMRRARGG